MSLLSLQDYISEQTITVDVTSIGIQQLDMTSPSGSALMLQKNVIAALWMSAMLKVCPSLRVLKII